WSETVAYSSLLLRGLLAGLIFLGLGAVVFAAAFFAIVFSMKRRCCEVPSSHGGWFYWIFCVSSTRPREIPRISLGFLTRGSPGAGTARFFPHFAAPREPAHAFGRRRARRGGRSIVPGAAPGGVEDLPLFTVFHGAHARLRRTFAAFRVSISRLARLRAVP